MMTRRCHERSELLVPPSDTSNSIEVTIPAERREKKNGRLTPDQVYLTGLQDAFDSDVGTNLNVFVVRPPPQLADG